MRRYMRAMLTAGVLFIAGSGTVRAQTMRAQNATLSFEKNCFVLADNAGKWRYTFRARPASGTAFATLRQQDRASAFDFGNGVTNRFTLLDTADGGVELRLAALKPIEFLVDVPASAIPARAIAGSRAEPEANPILQTADGTPANTRYNSLFAIDTDTLLMASGNATGPIMDGSTAVFRATAGEGLSRLRVIPNYYKTILKLPYYAPFRSPFPNGKIHSGWMDWYFTYGNMSEAFMLRNLAWLRDNLKPFGLDVFQLDMYWYKNNNYRELDPKKFQHDLKWYVGQVKAAGFVPGIWIGPWARDESMATAHPDWFLHDRDGKIIRDWPNDPPNVRPLLDGSNPGAQQEMYGLFRYLRNDIGFRYFKLDGQPVYRGQQGNARLFNPNMTQAEAYRAGYEQIRRAVGNDFLLSCWGIVPEGIGITNGSRTGGDVNLDQGLGTAADTTAKWLFLNRICWFADPDVLEVRAPEPLEKARAWTSLLGLSGQMLMLSDDMPALTPDRVELLRRVLPVANVRPVNLYPQTRADIMDARIQRDWETWDVVGLFNFGKSPATRTLDLNALGLDTPAGSRYLVYDFWRNELVGIVGDADMKDEARSNSANGGTMGLDVPGEGCRVVSVRRFKHRPQLLSTSRHITQGAVELHNVAWNVKTRVLSGVSDIVGGDAYTLTFSQPVSGGLRWRIVRAAVENQSGIKMAFTPVTGPTAKLTITAPKNARVRWRAAFVALPGQATAPTAPQEMKADYQPGQGVNLTWTGAANALTVTVLRDGRAIGTTNRTAFLDASLLPYGTHRYEFVAQGWEPSQSVTSQPLTVVLPPAQDTYLSELTPEREQQGWGSLMRDKSVDNHTLTIQGRTFAHGLGTHSTTGGIGEQVYALGGQFALFSAFVGIDDETAKRGSVMFQVWVDGAKRFDSGMMRGGDAAHAVTVDLRGAQSLRLVVTDGSDGFEYDHADWGDARLFAR